MSYPVKMIYPIKMEHILFQRAIKHWSDESSSLRFFSEVHLRIFTYSIKYEPRISEGICQITVEDLYLQTFQTNVVKISFLVYNFKVQMLVGETTK